MTFNIDEDPENADWIRTLSWDLPTTMPEFLRIIGGASGLPHFLRLPAARAMPESLKQDLLHAGLWPADVPR